MHLLRLSLLSDVERFCAFLRDVHVQVHGVDGADVTASIPGAQSPLHEGRELAGYVTTWNALNHGSLVEIVPGHLPAA